MDTDTCTDMEDDLPFLFKISTWTSSCHRRGRPRRRSSPLLALRRTPWPPRTPFLRKATVSTVVIPAYLRINHKKEYGLRTGPENHILVPSKNDIFPSLTWFLDLHITHFTIILSSFLHVLLFVIYSFYFAFSSSVWLCPVVGLWRGGRWTIFQIIGTPLKEKFPSGMFNVGLDLVGDVWLYSTYSMRKKTQLACWHNEIPFNGRLNVKLDRFFL